MLATYRALIRPRRGFTLIELLVVILVLAVLMAMALPLFLAAVTDGQRRTCRANMQTIANAEQAYRTHVAPHVYTTSLDVLLTDLGSVPLCPMYRGPGHAYTVTINDNGGITVACALSGGDHGSFTPGEQNE